jgi:hypothetical protein
VLSRVVAFLSLPIVGILAQAPVDVRISAANDAAYVIRMPGDSAQPRSLAPIVARGATQLSARVPVTIAAADSISQVHVEASEKGRVVVAVTAPFIVVSRDTSGGVTIHAEATVPQKPAPFRYSHRRP